MGESKKQISMNNTYFKIKQTIKCLFVYNYISTKERRGIPRLMVCGACVCVSVCRGDGEAGDVGKKARRSGTTETLNFMADNLYIVTVCMCACKKLEKM